MITQEKLGHQSSKEKVTDKTQKIEGIKCKAIYKKNKTI